MHRATRSSTSLVDWAEASPRAGSALDGSSSPSRTPRSRAASKLQRTPLRYYYLIFIVCGLICVWNLCRILVKRKADESEGACARWTSAYPAYGSQEQTAAVRALAATTSGGKSAGAEGFYHLVAFVPSGAAAVNRRDALRAQFARSAALIAPLGLRVRLYFVVGRNTESISGEAARHADMITVDCQDHDFGAEPAAGSATTCKIVKALHFAVASLDFLLWARIGDDSFFRVDHFLARIASAHFAERGVARAAFGRFVVPGGAIDKTLSASYGVDKLPLYPAGSGYVLGADIVRALASTDAAVGLIDGWPEDGVAGLWLSGLAYERVDSPCLHDTALLPGEDERDWSNLRGGAIVDSRGFTLRMPWELPPRRFNAGPCTADSILVHYMTQELWGMIGANGVLEECGHML